MDLPAISVSGFAQEFGECRDQFGVAALINGRFKFRYDDRPERIGKSPDLLCLGRQLYGNQRIELAILVLQAAQVIDHATIVIGKSVQDLFGPVINPVSGAGLRFH